MCVLCSRYRQLVHLCMLLHFKQYGSRSLAPLSLFLSVLLISACHSSFLPSIHPRFQPCLPCLPPSIQKPILSAGVTKINGGCYEYSSGPWSLEKHDVSQKWYKDVAGNFGHDLLGGRNAFWYQRFCFEDVSGKQFLNTSGQLLTVPESFLHILNWPDKPTGPSASFWKAVSF